jgi:ParB-like chromosome segregation protein Spo0J
MQTDDPPEFINNNKIEYTNQTSIKKLIVTISDEYEGLVPPLPDKDYQELKESIRKDGQFFPITVNEKGEILDGHHRFRACQELSIEPKIEIKEFDNLLDEKRFVIESNLKRRHLEMHERAALATELQSVEEEAAKDRQKQTQFSETNQPAVKKRLGKILPNREEKEEENKPKPEKNKEDESYKQKEENKSRERAAKQAKLSDETLRKYQYVLSKGKSDLVEKMTSGKIKIDKAYKMQKQDEIRQKLLETASTVIELSTDNNKELKNYDLKQGDFREVTKDIPDNSVDLIFTDPPYDKQSLPLYKDLGKLAQRVLKEGGSLVTYLGQYVLPETISYLLENDIGSSNIKLKYRWIFAIEHTGHSTAYHGSKIFVKWKPLLWFIKGDKISQISPCNSYVGNYIYDYIKSTPPDKALHEWEQSTKEAEYLISKLAPGENIGVVLDPMMGSGTTGIAALNLKRRFIGIEKEQEKFLIAEARITEFENKKTKFGNSNLESTKSESITNKVSITKGGNQYTNV